MNELVRILVVDDDETIRETFRLILEEEGYIVDTAENGKDAILKSNINDYNLALIDFRLPDMDGTEILGCMRQRVPKTIKIIVSGNPSAQIAVNRVGDACDSFMSKPVNFEKLLAEIRCSLKKNKDT